MSNNFFNPKPKVNFMDSVNNVFNTSQEEKSMALPNIQKKAAQLFDTNTGSKTDYKSKTPSGSQSNASTNAGGNTTSASGDTGMSALPKTSADAFNNLSKQAFGDVQRERTKAEIMSNPFLKRDGGLRNRHIDHERLLENPFISERTKQNLAEAFGVPYNNGTASQQPKVESQGAKIVNAAKQYMGTPYVWGGESMSEGGMDCSGFVYNALKDAGFDVGRTTAQGYREQGQSVSKENLREGDLVFFGSGNNATHIGIYLGGGQIIHSSGGSRNTASNPGKGVCITNLDNRSDFIEGRRY